MLTVRTWTRSRLRDACSAVTSEHPAEVMRHLCIPAIGRIKARAKDDG